MALKFFLNLFSSVKPLEYSIELADKYLTTILIPQAGSDKGGLKTLFSVYVKFKCGALKNSKIIPLYNITGKTGWAIQRYTAKALGGTKQDEGVSTTIQDKLILAKLANLIYPSCIRLLEIEMLRSKLHDTMYSVALQPKVSLTRIKRNAIVFAWSCASSPVKMDFTEQQQKILKEMENFCGDISTNMPTLGPLDNLGRPIFNTAHKLNLPEKVSQLCMTDKFNNTVMLRVAWVPLLFSVFEDIFFNAFSRNEMKDNSLAVLIHNLDLTNKQECIFLMSIIYARAAEIVEKRLNISKDSDEEYGLVTFIRAALELQILAEVYKELILTVQLPINDFGTYSSEVPSLDCSGVTTFDCRIIDMFEDKTIKFNNFNSKNKEIIGQLLGSDFMYDCGCPEYLYYFKQASIWAREIFTLGLPLLRDVLSDKKWQATSFDKSGKDMPIFVRVDFGKSHEEKQDPIVKFNADADLWYKTLISNSCKMVRRTKVEDARGFVYMDLFDTLHSIKNTEATIRDYKDLDLALMKLGL